MSVCNPCTYTKPIAKCLTNLVIGTIPQVNTHVKVYIVNKTLDRTIEYSTISAVDGKVTIPVTPQRFSEDHSYEIRITTADAIGVNESQDITIGDEMADCVQLRFETILKNDNTPATFINQILSIL